MLNEESSLKNMVEAVLLAVGKPMTEEQLLNLFSEEEKPSLEVLRDILRALAADCENRGIELIQVASGYRFQVKPQFSPWVSKLWEEKTHRYSRALLETLALIAYRQPITRGEIEDIRGVAVSTSILKTLQEDREWIRMVGHKEVPGRPALYATTKGFLDYFGLKDLQSLPSLPEIMNLDVVKMQEEFPNIPEENGVSPIAAIEEFDPTETIDVVDEIEDLEQTVESLENVDENETLNKEEENATF